MSQENVEIVRAVYDAAARRDSAGVLALYDRDVEWDASRIPEAALIGSRVAHGHDGLRRWFREWHQDWAILEYEHVDLIDAGKDVISVVLQRSRGRASGAETTLRRAGVWTIREGKVARVVWFPSVEEALEAAGLQE